MGKPKQVICPTCHIYTWGVIVDRGGYEEFHGYRTWMSNPILICPVCEAVLDENPEPIDRNNRKEDID